MSDAGVLRTHFAFNLMSLWQPYRIYPAEAQLCLVIIIIPLRPTTTYYITITTAPATSIRQTPTNEKLLKFAQNVVVTELQ